MKPNNIKEAEQLIIKYNSITVPMIRKVNKEIIFEHIAR